MMRISFMRRVDDTLGMWICFVLAKIAHAKRIFCYKRKKLDNTAVKMILCQKYFGMGSILNAIPLVKALRAEYPNVRIIFLTLESNREVLQLCGIADEVLTINFSSLGELFRDFFKTCFYFWRKKIDIAIDLEFFSKFPMIITFFTFAPVQIGLHQEKIRPKGITTHPVYYNSYKHLSQIYFAYATALGIEYKPGYFEKMLPLFKGEVREALSAKFGLKKNMSLVVINVNASKLFHSRRWPGDSFARLIALLFEHHPQCQYVMIGSQEDRAYVEEIAVKSGKEKHLINVAGKTDLQELFALIEMAYLVITNDSGPLHIASLYGVNIAAFFGPETPVVYGPLYKNTVVFYADDLYCSPCLNIYDSKKSLYGDECRDNKCLARFTAEMVYESVKKNFLKKP